jgi:hypothetical protein
MSFAPDDIRRAHHDNVNERRNVRLYAGVLVVEVLVLSAIWWFQRYFGS